jgi:hypothetical protein|tara:strand:- start:428 stop:700 length:273 start_codon:yes stop_codon:yes gene_type:complete
LKRKLGLALLLGAAVSWLNVGLSLAHEEDIHLGGLSRTASLAVIVAGLLLVGLFLGLFVLSWRRSNQSPVPVSGEDGWDEAGELDGQEEG